MNTINSKVDNSEAIVVRQILKMMINSENNVLKPGLEIVTSFELGENPVKDFLRKKYYEKINPEM